MKALRHGIPLSVLLVICPAAATAGYMESWDTDPPGNNGWYYFVEGEPNFGSVPMVWKALGGEGNNAGYVRCPLKQLTLWSEMPAVTAYWPCWTQDTHHLIDLRQSHDPAVKVYLKDDPDLTGPQPQPVDLGGGSVHFWVGEWQEGDPNKLSFYYFNEPLSYGTDWTFNGIEVTDNASDWTELINTLGKTPAQLLANPDQWGFGIFGGNSAPEGTLAFDSLANVPEPATLALLGLGAACLIRRRR